MENTQNPTNQPEQVPTDAHIGADVVAGQSFEEVTPQLTLPELPNIDEFNKEVDTEAEATKPKEQSTKWLDLFDDPDNSVVGRALGYVGEQGAKIPYSIVDTLDDLTGDNFLSPWEKNMTTVRAWANKRSFKEQYALEKNREATQGLTANLVEKLPGDIAGALIQGGLFKTAVGLKYGANGKYLLGDKLTGTKKLISRAGEEMLTGLYVDMVQFGGTEGRLSDMLPESKAIFTQGNWEQDENGFLVDTDPAYLKRIKSGLEGIFLGYALNGINKAYGAINPAKNPLGEKVAKQWADKFAEATSLQIQAERLTLAGFDTEALQVAQKAREVLGVAQTHADDVANAIGKRVKDSPDRTLQIAKQYDSVEHYADHLREFELYRDTKDWTLDSPDEFMQRNGMATDEELLAVVDVGINPNLLQKGLQRELKHAPGPWWNSVYPGFHEYLVEINNASIGKKLTKFVQAGDEAGFTKELERLGLSYHDAMALLPNDTVNSIQYNLQGKFNANAVSKTNAVPTDVGASPVFGVKVLADGKFEVDGIKVGDTATSPLHDVLNQIHADKDLDVNQKVALMQTVSQFNPTVFTSGLKILTGSTSNVPNALAEFNQGTRVIKLFKDIASIPSRALKGTLREELFHAYEAHLTTESKEFVNAEYRKAVAKLSKDSPVFGSVRKLADEQGLVSIYDLKLTNEQYDALLKQHGEAVKELVQPIGSNDFRMVRNEKFHKFANPSEFFANTLNEKYDTYNLDGEALTLDRFVYEGKKLWSKTVAMLSRQMGIQSFDRLFEATTKDSTDRIFLPASNGEVLGETTKSLNLAMQQKYEIAQKGVLYTALKVLDDAGGERKDIAQSIGDGVSMGDAIAGKPLPIALDMLRKTTSQQLTSVQLRDFTAMTDVDAEVARSVRFPNPRDIWFRLALGRTKSVEAAIGMWEASFGKLDVNARRTAISYAQGISKEAFKDGVKLSNEMERLFGYLKDISKAKQEGVISDESFVKGSKEIQEYIDDIKRKEFVGELNLHTLNTADKDVEFFRAFENLTAAMLGDSTYTFTKQDLAKKVGKLNDLGSFETMSAAAKASAKNVKEATILAGQMHILLQGHAYKVSELAKQVRESYASKVRDGKPVINTALINEFSVAIMEFADLQHQQKILKGEFGRGLGSFRKVMSKAPTQDELAQFARKTWQVSNETDAINLANKFTDFIDDPNVLMSHLETLELDKPLYNPGRMQIGADWYRNALMGNIFSQTKNVLSGLLNTSTDKINAYLGSKLMPTVARSKIAAARTALETKMLNDYFGQAWKVAVEPMKYFDEGVTLQTGLRQNSDETVRMNAISSYYKKLEAEIKKIEEKGDLTPTQQFKQKFNILMKYTGTLSFRSMAYFDEAITYMNYFGKYHGEVFEKLMLKSEQTLDTLSPEQFNQLVELNTSKANALTMKLMESKNLSDLLTKEVQSDSLKDRLIAGKGMFINEIDVRRTILNEVRESMPNFTGTPTLILQEAEKLISQDLPLPGKFNGLKYSEIVDPEGLHGINFNALNKTKGINFQQSLAKGGSVSQVVSKLGKVVQTDVPVLQFILPFINTPFNILRGGLEYMPGLNFASKEFRDDFFGYNGVQAQAQSRGKLAAGGILTATAFTLAYNSSITGAGPAEPKLRQQWIAEGNQPYSVKIGKTWYSYQNLEPISSVLGVIADLSDIHKYDPNDTQNFADNLWTVVVRNVTNKSFLTGLTNVLDAINDQDNKKFTSFVSSTGAGFIPSYLQPLNAFGDDETAKMTKDFASMVRNRVGLAYQNQARYNSLGEELKKLSPVAGGIVPLQTGSAKHNKIFEEMNALGHNFSPVTVNYNGLDLTNKIYDVRDKSAYTQLNEEISRTVVNGKTLTETLNDLITSDTYKSLEPRSKDGTTSPRVAEIQKILTKFRQRAFNNLLKVNSKLASDQQKLHYNKQVLKNGGSVTDLQDLAATSNFF